MFTFSPGFEAATLKIPNKEFTSYGGLIGGTNSSAITPGIGVGVGVNGIRSGAFHYAGLNDPYNMVTVNQGGVVVDGGRDGGMASWPATAPLNVNDDLAGSHYLGPGVNLSMSSLNAGGAPGSGVNLPPRKQIIGFAKFRSREEALAARDVLQGRRVDIEKGAVLKAEMAKKNLHTKRGVGPIPGGGGGSAMQHSQGQQQQTNALDPFDNYRERENTASTLPSTSLAHLSRLGWRDPVVGVTLQEANMNGLMNGPTARVDEERKRERDVVAMALAMGLPSTNTNNTSSVSSTAAGTAVTIAPRGARERAEDDERERRKKEMKEKERELNLMRLRANNSAAYDAFHGVSVGMLSRLSSAGIGGTGGSVNGTQLESVAGSSPLLAEVDTCQQQHYVDEVVGPWDVSSKCATTVSQPRSASQCSSSPPPNDVNRHEAEHKHEYDEYQLHIQQQVQHRREDSPSGYMSNENGDGRSGDGINDTPNELVLNTSGLHQLQRIGQYQHHPQTLQHQQQQLHDVGVGNGGSQTSGSCGNTSPQLPSPTSGGSTTSATSASLRGTVDQNPPVSYLALFSCV